MSGISRAAAYLPKDWTGNTLSILLIIFQVLHYIWRINRDEFIMDAGLGLFFLCVGLAPFILFGLAIVLLTIGATFWYSFSPKGHPFPVFVLFIGGFLSLFAPLPPSPAVTAFYRHQSDYEAVVELARQHQLGHNETCGYAFSLPEEYTHLTQRCVFIEYEPALAISFRPPTSHRTIVYAETSDALEELGDCGDHGSVYQALEANWYICTPAQD